MHINRSWALALHSSGLRKSIPYFRRLGRYLGYMATCLLRPLFSISGQHHGSPGCPTLIMQCTDPWHLVRLRSFCSPVGATMRTRMGYYLFFPNLHRVKDSCSFIGMIMVMRTLQLADVRTPADLPLSFTQVRRFILKGFAPSGGGFFKYYNVRVVICIRSTFQRSLRIQIFT